MTVDTTKCYDAQLWSRNLTEYRALVALRDADAAFGSYARQCEADDWKSYRFKETYGTTELKKLSAQAQAEWQLQVQAINDALEEHCQTYVDPADLAAIQLVRTIAPDMDAVETKVAVIKKHELDNNTRMVGDPFTIITQDVARLRGAQ